MKIADLLRDRIPAVMQRWDDRVRSEIPAARDQDHIVLRNALADMLEVMAKILASETDPRTATRDLAFITGHGSERAVLEAYTLEQMIEECQILQEIVFEEIEPVAPLTPRDRNVVFRYLGEFIRKAAGEFARVQTAQARSGEEDARRSEEQYRTLFNSIDEGFCVIEVLFDDADRPVDYRFLETNPAFERQTGLHDTIGKRVREMVPGHEQYWYEVYGRVAMTGEPVRFENEASALNRWYDVYAFRVGEPKQRRVAVLFTDVLARRQAEEALRKSEERQAFLLKLSDDLRGSGDPAAVQELAIHVLGRHLGASRVAFAEDAGDGETVALTRDYTDGVPSIEGRYRYADYGDGLLREMRAGRAVIRPDVANDPSLSHAQKAAHAVLQLGATLNVPLVKGGRLVAILAVHYRTAHAFSPEEVALVEDVAERTWAAVERAKAEAALRLSEERLRKTVNVSGVGVLTWDGASGTLLHANDAFLEMFDYTREEIEARAFTWRDFTPDEYVEESERQLEQMAVTGRIGPYEKEYLRKDGSRRWIMFVGADLGDGTIIEYAVDVSDRKRAEEAVRAADRAKSEFLAMLGHELRNPLGAATNALHLVQMQGRSLPSLQRPLQVLERQLTQMTRLVDDLLDVTRITQGRVKLEMRPVALDEVVAAALRSLLSRIQEKGLRYRYEGDPGAVVTGDALRLEQVATNLIGNAVKYTDAGSIHVAVRVKNGEVMLRVRDTGIGIAPGELAHVFDLFSQVRTDLARTQGGLGIGLTVVQQMVEQHGGRVHVESKGLGHGSTFTVMLPLCSERPSLSAAEAAAAPTATPYRQDQPLRVLVVDDNTDAAESLVDILETWGYEARAVHDGIEAVNAILAEAPDVALIDIGLPGLDGYQVARTIRQNLGPDGVTLIAVTGYGQAEDRGRAFAAGFDHHVPKPVDLPALERLLGAAPDVSA